MYFKSIQELRGVAALSVLLYHVSVYLRLMGNNPDTAFRHVNDNFGKDGVILFFVISGFVMAYILNSDAERFFFKRIIRIYPPYIAAVILVILVKLCIFGGISTPKLHYALSLLPVGEQTYPLSVEWSLIYEIFFYAICSVFALRFFRYFFPYFLVAWFIVIYIAQHYYHAPTLLLPTAGDIFFSAFNIPFILGGISFYAFKNAQRHAEQLDDKYLGGVFAIGAALFVIHFRLSEFPLRLAFLGAGLGLVIFVATLRDAKKENTGRKTLLERFGDNSYGIYLLHVPVITIIYSLMNSRLGKIDEYAAFLALFLALTIGYYFGKIDVFMHRNLKRRLFNKQVRQIEKN